VSPKSHREAIGEAAARAVARMTGSMGQTIHEGRVRRRWTLRRLAGEAGLSPSLVQRLEAGAGVSLEAYVRVAIALDLRPQLDATDPRKRTSGALRAEDPVHSAMGEAEARRLRGHRFGVAIDEPYQHFQFAGRADVLSWDIERRALLHLENRTRFPNVQEAIGSYNAKRAYLPAILAERLGIGPQGWASVTNALVVLCSAEALHAIRMHLDTFGAVCSDPPIDLEGWWRGELPSASRASSTLIIFDPVAGRGREFVGLGEVAALRARYRGYADAAAVLRA
jgi:transcriptional regulator with XRE-family HTH domain